MGLISEFREFAVKGNVMDMAVGIIIGGAFGKIVSSFVGDLLMPPIGLLMKGVDFSEIAITLKEASVDAAGAEVPAVTINLGTFLNTAIDFVIVAFAVFLLVKSVNTMRRRLEKEKEAAPPPPPPGPSNEEKLLGEIRDLLKKA